MIKKIYTKKVFNQPSTLTIRSSPLAEKPQQKTFGKFIFFLFHEKSAKDFLLLLFLNWKRQTENHTNQLFFSLPPLCVSFPNSRAPENLAGARRREGKGIFKMLHETFYNLIIMDCVIEIIVVWLRLRSSFCLSSFLLCHEIEIGKTRHLSHSAQAFCCHLIHIFIHLLINSSCS